MTTFKTSFKFEELLQKNNWLPFKKEHLLNDFIEGDFIERLQQTKKISLITEYYLISNDRLRVIAFEEGFHSHKFEMIWLLQEKNLENETDILNYILKTPFSLSVSYEQVFI